MMIKLQGDDDDDDRELRKRTLRHILCGNNSHTRSP
jgi:hypothetical protein